MLKNRPLLFITLVMLTATPGFAASYRLLLKGSFSAPGPSPSIKIYYDGSDDGGECSPNGSNAAGNSISCLRITSNKTAPQIMRIEIERSGYKKISKNFPAIPWKAIGKTALLSTSVYEAVLDIGIVVGEPLDLLQVGSVVWAEAQDGRQKFDIVFENRTQKEMLITNIKVRAFHDGVKGDCCCPPTAVFLLEDVAHVGIERRDGPTPIDTKVEEKLQGAGYLIPANGQIEHDNCDNWTSLSLDFHSAVVIPAARYTAIQIMLPAKLKIVSATLKYGNGMLPDDSHRLLNPSNVQEGSIRLFDQFTFSFRTSEDEIVAHYKR
jgi:hypothetical protein